MTTTTTALATQVYQVFIKASPDQIWDAITKPEFTLQYFHGTRAAHELRPGGAYLTLAGDCDDVLVDGEVLEVDAPRRFVHTWRALYDPDMGAEEPSRVTWEIAAQDGGVAKLSVVHDQLEHAPKTAENVAGGWMYILSGLKTLLETGEPLAQG